MKRWLKMKYKELDNAIVEVIQNKLHEIEKKQNVKILYAVESGSRAWGFASPDSDYDVRFVYIRPMEHYLSLEEQPDFIEWELNEILDINGWDLSKTLQHVYKSNATVFEWSNSPIIYSSIPEWEQVRQVSEKYFSCKSAMYHYYATAKKNFYEYLQEEKVLYKKYFYVLRPILACKWIEKEQVPPPVLFSDLEKAVLEDKLKENVEQLRNKKIQMTEAEKGERIESINTYILQNLAELKEKLEIKKEDRKREWEPLNQVFRNCLTSLWK